ncbi:NB-ARC domain-containing protein [Scytonema sp. NUACC26]|uniref:WD40 domain-containing protein n=1 Tax=Scytonema sp. NUACC26 TaxID=3140176 RepID=UPI0038B2A97F
MTIEEALVIIDTALRPESLSDLQELILRHSWEGKSYPEIGEICGYDPNYVKDAGSKLWKLLSKSLGEEISKSNFRTVFRRLAAAEGKAPQTQAGQQGDSEENSTTSSARPQAPSPKPQTPSRKQDWGDAVDVPIFLGREQEINTLRQWIVEENCRLIALLGMGGIGKTALSIEFAEQIQNEFEYVIWRNLRNAPTIEDLLLSLLQFLSNQQATEATLPKDVNGRISRLIDYLRSSRSLLVLDNAETIMGGGNRAGQYIEGYEGYGDLFRRIGETRHQSCLLLTSREKPKEFVVLEGEMLPVRSLPITGLPQTDVREILRAKGQFSGSENEWQFLISHYAGNPLALKIVAGGILDLFDGSISNYLEILNQGTLIFDDIRDLLKLDFLRLLELEKEVMYWLAIEREPVSLLELREYVISPEAKQKLPETLRGLGQRSLVEKTANGFTQQPVVMDYIIERLIEESYQEVVSGEVKIIQNHSLLNAQAKDYIREAQTRLIVKPLIDKLLVGSDRTKLEDRLKKILEKEREKIQLEPGYVAGNILNILSQLKIDLTGYDFSHLTVWQAYLQDTCLQKVNFTGADLAKSVFAETLSSVTSVAFSSDGELLATSDVNCEVRLWEIKDVQIRYIASLKGHTNWVHSVAFSPVSSSKPEGMIASGSEDQTVRIWDISKGECIQVLQGHTRRVWSVAFSPKAVDSTLEGIVASGGDDCTIKLWDVTTGECLKTLHEHTAGVSSVAFHPHGNLLASGSGDGTIRFWEIAEDRSLKVLEGHGGSVSSVAFSPDGSLLASGSEDGTVRLWDVKEASCIKTIQGHMGLVWSVAFSPDGSLLASGSEDRTVRLWDISEGNCIRILDRHTNRVWSVAFHPIFQDGLGSILVSGSKDQTVRLWNVANGSCLRTIRGYTNWIGLISFSPDGKLLASANEDRTVMLWDVADGKCQAVLKGHTHQVWSVAFNLDGKILASGSEDRTVRLWNVNDSRCVRVLSGHTSRVWSVAFSSDGKTLASGSGDCTIKIWDVDSGKCRRTLNEHASLVWSVAFCPASVSGSYKDGILASGSGDRTIKIWDINTGECIKTLEGHKSWVFSVAFSPDGKILASSGADGTIRLWDISEGTCIKILKVDTKLILQLAFMPTVGRQNMPTLLACGSDDRKIRIWDISQGECITVLQGHDAWIWSVAFSPDGKILASGSQDETIKLWDMNTHENIKTLVPEKPYEGMNITDIKGLNQANIATLKSLGAVEFGMEGEEKDSI